jgi:hypothetical protein
VAARLQHNAGTSATQTFAAAGNAFVDGLATAHRDWQHNRSKTDLAGLTGADLSNDPLYDSDFGASYSGSIFNADHPPKWVRFAF